MSKFVSGILGAAALVASLGAAQFAVGHDLGKGPEIAGAAQSSLVNRSAKADRPIGIAPAGGGTIVSKLASLDATSVVIRVPRAAAKTESKLQRKADRRPVACEAPASVLTEVAKLMESGRCVT